MVFLDDRKSVNAYDYIPTPMEICRRDNATPETRDRSSIPIFYDLDLLNADLISILYMLPCVTGWGLFNVLAQAKKRLGWICSVQFRSNLAQRPAKNH